MRDNTLFLRLAGPMQSWGTSSRFQLRRTDSVPSKSGVLGLLLCAMGVKRADSPAHLPTLSKLAMGVRVDHAGNTGWDYHTAGAKIGLLSAEGKPKVTESTGKLETLLSRRQYLYDASFLVALMGEEDTIARCAAALADPVWPLFLGRKCCIPAEPVLRGTACHASLPEALAATPWPARSAADAKIGSRSLEAFLEHVPMAAIPDHARIVYDVPRRFGFYNYTPRWVIPCRISVSVEPRHASSAGAWADPYGPQWPELRRQRLELDHGLCVFCKSAADQMHHLDYADVRLQTLRSLCGLCHEACTSLEYGADMRRQRFDPCDLANRQRMLSQVQKILSSRRYSRRGELLAAKQPDTQ